MIMSSLSPYVYECTLTDLTLEYASTIVPSEFLPAWQWYQSMEGQLIPRLPMGDDSPAELPIKIAEQSGIHSPSEDDIEGGWHNDRKYAVTVHTSNGKRYNDKNLITRPDGTWLLEYAAQKTEEGRERQRDHNQPLLNCLEDGVPVGVLLGQSGRGYRVLGLAFVERYDVRNGFFTLHGPVNEATERQRLFSMLISDSLSPADWTKLQELQRIALMDGDERVKTLVRKAKRDQQAKFRNDVFSAYEGRCAASGTGVEDILQAAHIDDFRGKISQIVQNGILLRVDIHMLYDANLLGIEPESHRIVLSNAVNLEPYEYLSDKRLRLPKDPSKQPDDELLEIHFKRFLSHQSAA